MDTRELQALIAVADEQSFHGAAASLGLTQPAITRRIQRLEERIGAQLFDRSLKPLQPTAAGLRALSEARDLLRRLDGFGQNVTAGRARSGPLRLGISHGAAPLMAARELRALQQCFPDLSLTIKSGWAAELLPLLRRGEIDAMLALNGPAGLPGVATMDNLPTNLVSHKLLDDEIVAIGPHSLPEYPQSVAELARHPLVLMPEGCTFRAMGNLWARQNNVRFSSVLEVSALDLQIEMVAAGAGFGIMARRFCMHSTVYDKIRILDIPGMKWKMAISLIRRANTADLDDVIEQIARIVIDAGTMDDEVIGLPAGLVAAHPHAAKLSA